MELPDSVKAIGEQVEHQRETGGGEITPGPELFEAYDVFAAELQQIFTQPWLAVDHASRLAAGRAGRRRIGSARPRRSGGKPPPTLQDELELEAAAPVSLGVARSGARSRRV